MRRLLTLAFLAALAFAALFAFLYVQPWYGGAERPKGGEPVEVTVARGDTLGAAARKLEAAGVIASATHFRRLAGLLGDDAPIKAGEYGFYPTEAGPGTWRRCRRACRSSASSRSRKACRRFSCTTG